MKFKLCEENFIILLKCNNLLKFCLLYLFSLNLCRYKKGKKSYVRNCAFSLITVRRTIFYVSFLIF